MRFSQAFPSQYLTAADLQGRRIKVTIDRIDQEEIGQKKELLPVLYFRGAQKGMILTKTKGNEIALVYGDEMDDWIGAEIELFEMLVRWPDGQMKPGLHVAVPRPARQRQESVVHRPLTNSVHTAPPAAGPPPAPPMTDDEIPF